MSRLNKVYKENEPDIKDVVDWCDSIYKKTFLPHFGNTRQLFDKLKDKDHVITDDELSIILIDLPVRLIDISEALQQLKLSNEVVKLNNRRNEVDLMMASLQPTVTKKKEEAEMLQLDNKLLAMAYSSIIDRVTSEISFSRELIMGAKKIWDARRNTERVNPVSEVDPLSNLPDYTIGR